MTHPLRTAGLTCVMLLLALWVSSTPPRMDVSSPLDGSVMAELDTYPWLYLRDGRHIAYNEAVVEIIAVGDVMLARGVEEAANAGRAPFAAAAPWLRSADLVLGNLECTIAAEGTPRTGPYRLRAPVSAAAALRDAGFDILNLANNHTLDLGPEGLAETVSRLNQAGIITFGAGRDQHAAMKASVVDVNDLRIGFLAFNAVPDPQAALSDNGDWTVATWNRERLLQAIALMKAGSELTPPVDAVVVSAHWGYEYQLRPDPSQRKWADELLAAGADLVLGHHPHVVQGAERLHDGFVAYSLGNFVFDQEQGETRQGLALRAFFDAQGLRAVQALPVWSGPQPRLMSLRDAAPLLGRVVPPDGSTASVQQQHALNDLPTQPTPSDASEHAWGNGHLTEPASVGFSCAMPPDAATGADTPSICISVDAQPDALSGILRAGEIDLTGDGIPETVMLNGDNVLIRSEDDVVDIDDRSWRGLPDWRVVDIALGDPNNDGRAELLLALFKPDQDGVIHSHPFILGFREGAYRILWGGSAVNEPVHEVELGDVDGDGVQELVVLEEASDGEPTPDRTGLTNLKAVTVWDWHGWGFSLAWRSPPGRYRNLVLAPSEKGMPPIINVTVDPGKPSIEP